MHGYGRKAAECFFALWSLKGSTPRRLLISSKLEGAAFIRGRHLFEGSVYYYDPELRARSALIRSRQIDEHGCSRQPELGHGQS